MGRPVRHVLMTRFNVALFSDRRPGLDHAWFAARLALFEQWTLPSVRRQTAPPEAWVIFVDDATDADLLRRLAALVAGCAVIVGVHGLWRDQVAAAAVADGLPGTDDIRLITSRLDCDDAISPSYLRVVRALGEERLGLINSCEGYQIHLGSGRVTRRMDFASPFLSLAEDPASAPIRTAFCGPHHEAIREHPKQTAAAPWLQVVHATNVANVMEGVPTTRGRVEDVVGLDLPAPPGEMTTTRLMPVAPLRMACTVARNGVGWLRGAR